MSLLGREEIEQYSLYEKLLDIVCEAIIIINNYQSEKIVYANNKALKLFGYSRDEIIQKSINDFLPDFNLKAAKANAEKTCEPIRTKGKKNGTLFSALVRVSSIILEEKEFDVVLIRDLTEDEIKEEKIRLSEERYRAIVEDQIELICRFTPDGILTFVNTAYCNFFNKKAEDLIGKTFLDLIPDEHKDFVKSSFQSVTKEKPYNHYDHKVVGPNGEIRWMHWSDRAIFDENGNIKEYQSIGFDITERKELEEKLIKSRQRYLDILDSLQDGFYQTDKDGKITFISNSALGLLGYADRSKVLGQSIENRFVNPNGRQEFLNRLRLAGGRLYNQEVQILNKNNEIVFVSVNAQIKYDENGNFNGTQGTIRDITEYKDTLHEIKRLYTVVEGSQNGLIIIELDGTVSYANKAVLTIAKSPPSVTIEEHVLGRHVKTFLSFDEPTTLASVCEEIERNHKWFGPAYIFCACSNVERVPIDIMFSRIVDEDDDNREYIVASFYDTTERRSLENKIKEQARMYEELQHEVMILVQQMNDFNNNKFEKLSDLEETFYISLEDLRKFRGGPS